VNNVWKQFIEFDLATRSGGTNASSSDGAQRDTALQLFRGVENQLSEFDIVPNIALKYFALETNIFSGIAISNFFKKKIT
jgi:hypothetical protein